MKIEEYILELTEDIMKVKFRKYQVPAILKFVKSIVDGEMLEIPLFWSRQAGKTFAALVFIVLAIHLPAFAVNAKMLDLHPELARFKDGYRHAFTAPGEWQAKIPMQRLRDNVETNPRINAYAEKFGATITTNNIMRMAFANGSRIDVHTGKTGSAKEGDTYHSIWHEEAQDMSTFAIRKVFSPMLSSTKGTKIFVGTAGMVKGDFYDVITYCERYEPESLFVLTYDQAEAEIDGYKEYVEKEIKHVPGGLRNPYVRMSYFLEWQAGGGALISDKAFNRCVADGKDRRPYFERGQLDLVRFHKYLLTIDFAKVNDKTVLTLWECHTDHYRILDFVELWQVSHKAQDRLCLAYGHILLGSKNIERIYQLAVKEREINLPDKKNAEIYDNIQTLLFKKPWLAAIEKPLDFSVVCDSTGIGDVRTERYIDEFPNHEVVPVVYTAPIKNQFYLMFKSVAATSGDEMSRFYFYGGASFEDKEFIQCTKEFLDCVVEEKGLKYTYHHRKTKQAEKELGFTLHDDYVDSVMQGIYYFEATNMIQGRII